MVEWSLANITRLLAKERQGSFDLLSKNGADQRLPIATTEMSCPSTKVIERY